MTVVYGATKNLYEPLKTAMFSMLQCNPQVKILCIIEDDELPYDTPKQIKIVNFKNLPHAISDTSPNYNSVFTYMSLVRLELPLILPDEDKVLWMDVDTLVQGSMKEVLNMKMDGYAIAGVLDIQNPIPDKASDYINSGVLLMNLDYLRESGMYERIIEEVNTTKYLYCDQDVLNFVCNGKKKLLDVKYNDFVSKPRTFDPVVTHWAGYKEWWKPKAALSELWNRYATLCDRQRSR